MAVYDANGNLVADIGGGGSQGELDENILRQLHYTLPFETWQQGKLNDVAVGAKQTVGSSTTNYCINPSNALYFKAGTLIKITSSTSHDLSYKRLDANGMYVSNMLNDGLSRYTYMRGTSFQFVLVYDGYYCFNSYNTGYSDSSVAVANLGNFEIYGSEYIEKFSSYDLWKDSPNDFMRSINHRGYTAGGATANTMPSFEDSKKHGYVFIECDLRLTSDSEVVLCHDETITGTVNGTSQTLTIANSTLADLQAMTINSGRYACTIATLDELLEWCRINKIHPYLDMKITTESAMDLYLEKVIKHGMLRHVSWSGDVTTSTYIKAKDAKARLVCLSGSVANLSALLNGQNEVVLNTSISNITSASYVKNYASEGITVEAYKINAPTSAEIKEMASYGVTGMTIDAMHCQKVITS